MIAAERATVQRTVGDTDPIAFELSVTEQDGSTSKVADASVVTMHLASSPITSIIASAQGASSGVFLFPAGSLPASQGQVRFEIEVNDGSSVYTHTRGSLTLRPQIL